MTHSACQKILRALLSNSYFFLERKKQRTLKAVLILSTAYLQIKKLNFIQKVFGQAFFKKLVGVWRQSLRGRRAKRGWRFSRKGPAAAERPAAAAGK